MVRITSVCFDGTAVSAVTAVVRAVADKVLDVLKENDLNGAPP